MCDLSQRLHKGEFQLKNNGKTKNNVKYATQMNVLRSQLLQATQAEEPFFATLQKKLGSG